MGEAATAGGSLVNATEIVMAASAILFNVSRMVVSMLQDIGVASRDGTVQLDSVNAYTN